MIAPASSGSFGSTASPVVPSVTTAVASPVDRHRTGRDGALALRFVRRGDRTVLASCRFTLPLQVLAPLSLPDEACVVSLLNPTGGVVGGDRLRIDVDVERGAHACLTTPSATRIYRTAAEPARCPRVPFSADAGAKLDSTSAGYAPASKPVRSAVPTTLKASAGSFR